MILAGLSLWQLRSSRPELSKDVDVVFSSIGVLVGGILIFQGWRLDPLLLFGQLLTISAAVAFAVETVSLRRDVLERDRQLYLGPPTEEQREETQWKEGAMLPLPPPSASRFSNWEEPWQGNTVEDRDRYYDDAGYDAYAYEEEAADQRAGGPPRREARWGEGPAWQEGTTRQETADWQDDRPVGQQQSKREDRGDSKGRWGSGRGRVDMLDDWDS